jgi:hypothetical protein
VDDSCGAINKEKKQERQFEEYREEFGERWTITRKITEENWKRD